MSKQQKKRKEITTDRFFPGSSQDMTQELDQELPTNFKEALEDLKIQLTHELKIQLTHELKIQLTQELKIQLIQERKKTKRGRRELEKGNI